MYYLDTSVVVALYIPELKSNRIQALVSDCGGGGTAISTLTELEFNSAVSRRVRMKEISPEDGLLIISQFQLHVKNRLYRMISLSQAENNLARDWMGNFETSLRSLDALHLALAFSNKMELVSADVALVKSAGKLGIKAISI